MLVGQMGTSCLEFSFLSLYLIPSFRFQSLDCCCGICCTCGPTQVLRTAGVLLQELFGAQWFIQRHSPVHPHGNIPTYEENLILNQLINATILHQSYQHILICEGAYKHILHHIYILAI